jgi:hypothetical protein
LRKFLELPNGIPDESTFFRVFKRIQPGQPAQCLYEWLAGARETEGRAVNSDGKTIRGSGGVEEKSNEIRAIPKLPEILDIKGSVITYGAKVPAAPLLIPVFWDTISYKGGWGEDRVGTLSLAPGRRNFGGVQSGKGPDGRGGGGFAYYRG